MLIDKALYKVSAFNSQETGDSFFNQFPFTKYIRDCQYTEVINLGIDLLRECKAIDSKAFFSIHKGTPYYWMGMAAFLSFDFDIATYYFDAALAEDIKNKTTDKLTRSPSYLFVTLNDKIEFQAAKDLVTNTKRTIEDFLNIYNDPYLATDKINLDYVQEHLIIPSLTYPNHPWRILSVSLLSFFLEWNYLQTLISLREMDNSKEPFFLHLFKGCLLFESILKNTDKIKNKNDNQENKKTLRDVLEILKSELGLSAENLKIGNTTFPLILEELKTIHGGLPKYIEITGKIGNTLGHNLVWKTQLYEEDYQKLFTCIALSILHAIRTLF